MEILILGNGFECQYNPNVCNFNQKFIEFIADKEKTDKLLAEIFQFCRHDKEIYEEIVQVIRNEISYEGNFSLEDKLRIIGEQVMENSENKDEVFHCLKNLIGFYIYERTKDYEDIENFLEFRKLSSPDEIWTTNYTNSARNTYSSWKRSKIFSSGSLDLEKNKYLHGKFQLTIQGNEKNITDDTFQNIEINLVEKNEELLRENLLRVINESKDSSLIINVFGLSFNNDENIFYVLADELENLDNNYQINLYYYTNEDKLSFNEFKQKNRYKNPHDFRTFELPEKKIYRKINIFDAKEYKRFKLKKK